MAQNPKQLERVQALFDHAMAVKTRNAQLLALLEAHQRLTEAHERLTTLLTKDADRGELGGAKARQGGSI